MGNQINSSRQSYDAVIMEFKEFSSKRYNREKEGWFFISYGRQCGYLLRCRIEYYPIGYQGLSIDDFFLPE